MTILIYLCNFVIPLVIFIVALISKANPKKEINDTVGYRTRRSKASQEAWDYAQEQFPRQMFVAAGITCVMAVIGTIVMFFIGDLIVKTLVLSGVACVQGIALVIIILAIENQLKEKFGE